MSQLNSLPEKKRRSQEERRQETRKKLITATIQVINEKGFAAMRTGDITKKAGVTWGAAQHLFGGKTELLTQVAAAVSDSLIDILETDINVNISPKEKLALIIDQTWELYSSKSYFAMVEIVRGTRKDPNLHDNLIIAQAKISQKVEKLWLHIFDSDQVSSEKVLKLCHIVTLYLSGLAARKIYTTPSAETEKYIEYIKEITFTEINLH